MSPEQLDLFHHPLQRVQELKKDGDLPAARAALEGLVRESPDNLAARAALADVYYRAGNFKAALSQAAEILRRDPRDPRALVVSGNVMLEKKQPAAAEEYFQAALAIAPTDYLRLRLVECRLRLNQPDEAAKILQQVEAERESLAFLHLQFWLAVQHEQTQAAREILVRAASQADARPEVFARQMLRFLSRCSTARAVEYSEAARRAAGRGQNPYLILYEAGLLLRLRQTAQAAERLALLADESLPPGLLREKQRLARRLVRQQRGRARG